MSNDAFAKAVDRHVEASQKLDYLLVAVASGLLAYSVDKYIPTSPVAVRALTVLAWAFLAVTIWCGLKRIQTTVDILQMDVIDLARDPAKPGALQSTVLADRYDLLFRHFGRLGRVRDSVFLASFLLLALAQLLRAW